MSAELELDWNMAVEGGQLAVSYRVANRSARRIYVCDGVLAGGSREKTWKRLAGRFVVSEAEPGHAELVLGSASADNPMYMLPMPSFAPVEPGASLQATTRLPLPLTTWHNAGWMRPFTVPPRTASLVIDYLVGEPEWQELPADTGGAIRVPAAFDDLRRVIESERRPIPSS